MVVKTYMLLMFSIFYSVWGYAHVLEDNFSVAQSYMVPNKNILDDSFNVIPKKFNKIIDIRIDDDFVLEFSFETDFSILRNQHVKESFKPFVVNPSHKLHLLKVDELKMAIDIHNDYQLCKICSNYEYNDKSLEEIMEITPEIFNKIKVDEVVPYISMLYKKLNLLTPDVDEIIKININSKNLFIMKSSFFTNVIFPVNNKVITLIFNETQHDDINFLNILNTFKVKKSKNQ